MDIGAGADEVVGSLEAGSPLLSIVRGDRGSGRSTVLSDLAERLRAAGVEVMHARCHVDECARENGIVRQLLECGGNAVDPPESLTIDVLHRSITEKGGDSPVAVLIDDLNFADEASLTALTYLSRRLDARSVGMVMTVDAQDHRTARLIAELARLPYARVHTVTPLSAEEEAGVLAKIVGRELSPRTLDIVRCTTQGNPQVVSMAGQELASRLVSDDEPPETIHECCALATWNTRLQWVEQSHPNAADLYRAMLVLGRDADQIDAAALCDLQAGAARDARRVLARCGLLTGDTLQPIDEHRVHHYDRLKPEQAVDLHRRAVSLAHRLGMSARSIASHVMHSNQELCQDDLILLRRAAQEAIEVGDWHGAQQTLRHALTQCGDGATCHGLLLDLHHVQLRSDVQACTQSTLALPRAGVADEVMARELASLTHLLLAANYTPVSTVLKGLADQVAAGTSSAPPSLTAQAFLLRSAPPARELDPETLADPSVQIARALRLAGVGRHRDRCLDLLQQVVPDPTALAEDDPMLIALAALAATWTEQLSSAQFWATEGASVARAEHRPVEEAVNLLVRALSNERIGQLQAALADADAARTLFEAANADAFAEVARAVHAEGCIQIGQIDRAAATMDGLRPRAAVHPLLSATVAHTLGRLAQARGDSAGALAQLLSCPRYLHTVGVCGPSAVMWHPTMIRVLAQSGRDDASRTMAQRHLANARAWGAPGLIGQALHARAASASGIDRIGFLRASEEQLAQAGMERRRHAVLTELAACCAMYGDADAAQWALKEAENAQGSFTSETVDDEADPPIVRLSRAEQRVADLVLEGHSNASVAKQLYLSKRTVDTHLGRIYKKLGINSRTQLAAALEGDVASAS